MASRYFGSCSHQDADGMRCMKEYGHDGAHAVQVVNVQPVKETK